MGFVMSSWPEWQNKEKFLETGNTALWHKPPQEKIRSSIESHHPSERLQEGSPGINTPSHISPTSKLLLSFSVDQMQ
jgi:hypothetical protein